MSFSSGRIRFNDECRPDNRKYDTSTPYYIDNGFCADEIVINIIVICRSPQIPTHTMSSKQLQTKIERLLSIFPALSISRLQHVPKESRFQQPHECHLLPTRGKLTSLISIATHYSVFTFLSLSTQWAIRSVDIFLFALSRLQSVMVFSPLSGYTHVHTLGFRIYDSADVRFEKEMFVYQMGFKRQ